MLECMECMYETLSLRLSHPFGWCLQYSKYRSFWFIFFFSIHKTLNPNDCRNFLLAADSFGRLLADDTTEEEEEEDDVARLRDCLQILDESQLPLYLSDPYTIIVYSLFI